MSDGGQNIQVFVRCRPLGSEERRSAIELLSDQKEIRVPPHSRDFHFDQVFSPDAPQEHVFNSVVRPLIPQVLAGFNCAIFAYGQTGTGKTYTMEGKKLEPGVDLGEIGIIPRAIDHIFDILRQRGQEFDIKISFLELYSEEAYDLLSSPEDINKLRIFDDVNKKGSVKIDGLKEVHIESASQIYGVLARGSAKRQSAATMLNACSSRSHGIFTITVTVKVNTIGSAESSIPNLDQEIFKIGKLNLVDLAGSENIARSGALNKHAREAGNINQSLLTLTRVITALVEKRPHIPYRESKLTRILQDSLGGSTKTSMIATISPAEEDLGNTIGTLDYASRARCIINKPESNRQMTQRKTSDLDVEAYKSTIRNEVEINIRNEVALEFRTEIDKIKEQFAKALSEKNEQLFKANQLINEQLSKTSSLENKVAELVRELELNLTESSKKYAELVGELELKSIELSKNEEELRKYQGAKIDSSSLQDENNALKKQFDQLTNEVSGLQQINNDLVHQNKELSKNYRIIQQLANDREELNDNLRIDFKRDLDEKVLLIKDLEGELAKMRENCHCNKRLSNGSNSNCENHAIHLNELPEETIDADKPQVKKASRVRKRAPVQEELNDYANMTFDGDDEIIQLSAKKGRKQITAGGRKRELHKELTLSGKKRRLRSVDEDVELSPVSPPVRVTRSRATRRKLDY